MSATTRDQRATVYNYAPVNTDGVEATSYVRVNSTSADKGWWCRIEPVTSSESMIAQQQSLRVDALIEFSLEVTGLTADGAVRHLASGTMYKIVGLRKNRDGRMWIVQAVEVQDEVYDNVVETP